jgi:hypothetical protein
MTIHEIVLSFYKCSFSTKICVLIWNIRMYTWNFISDCIWYFKEHFYVFSITDATCESNHQLWHSGQKKLYYLNTNLGTNTASNFISFKVVEPSSCKKLSLLNLKWLFQRHVQFTLLPATSKVLRIASDFYHFYHRENPTEVATITNQHHYKIN